MAKKNILSRFAHLAGLRADDTAEPETDVTKVDDKVNDLADAQDETQNDVKSFEDRLDACEARLDALEADDDDNDGDEMGDDPDPDAPADDKKPEASAFKRGRLAERARAAAIFAEPTAAANPVLASELAFNSGISVTKAAALLQASSTPAQVSKGTLAARMATVKPIKIIPEASASSERTPAQRLAAAAEKLGK